LGVVLHPIEGWYQSRYPSVVVTLHPHGTSPIARIASFSKPVFVRAVTFELLLERVKDEITVDRMVAPYVQIDCRLPAKILHALVLRADLAVSASYRTPSGREAKSEARIFNLIGGDGQITEVRDSGNYLSIGKCPVCGDETLFANDGVTSKRALEKRKKAFENAMRGTCPDHDSARAQYWF
jgi:hypothetical protein